MIILSPQDMELISLALRTLSEALSHRIIAEPDAYKAQVFGSALCDATELHSRLTTAMQTETGDVEQAAEDYRKVHETIARAKDVVRKAAARGAVPPSIRKPEGES